MLLNFISTIVWVVPCDISDSAKLKTLNFYVISCFKKILYRYRMYINLKKMKEKIDNFYLDYYEDSVGSREPVRMSGELDGMVSLQCPLEGQVSWRKDGAPLPPTAQQVK